MKFKTVPLFDKELKKLSKKYNSIKKDILSFTNNFNNIHATAINIKTNLYKIRVNNSNKNRGKRAGYRIYYYVKVEDTVYLLTIYDKSEKESINENILDKFISEL